MSTRETLLDMKNTIVRYLQPHASRPMLRKNYVEKPGAIVVIKYYYGFGV
jgi:hypothetical protein